MSPVSWGDIFTLLLRGDRIMELRHTRSFTLTLWKLRTSLIRLFLMSACGCSSTSRSQERFMHRKQIRGCAFALCLGVLLVLFGGAPALHAQGGEPQYFAIRGAKVVPVSGPAIENATVVISRGVISA